MGHGAVSNRTELIGPSGTKYREAEFVDSRGIQSIDARLNAELRTLPKVILSRFGQVIANPVGEWRRYIK